MLIYNMNIHDRIVLLIKKLLDDQLSSNELHELQQFFRPAEAQDEVLIWLEELWKESDRQDYPIDSKQMLELLHRKIYHSKQKEKPICPTRNKILNLSFLRKLLRYAAVFILAVAFSRFWFYRDKPSVEIPLVASTIIAIGSNEISVTYGSKTRIVLPDSSIVYLNSGSQLSYPSAFDDERHVTLTGEGYFVVHSDSLHPFIVRTHDVNIRALGTEFNVKAYPEEQSVETMLVKGVVEILKKDQVKPIIELKPGEKATYIKSEPVQQQQKQFTQLAKGYPQMVVGVEQKVDLSTSWVKNQLVFDAEPFDQIAVKLERWYNVEIDIRSKTLGKERLSGRYDTESIEQVMHSLQMATSFRYTIEKNKIVIK